MYGITTIGRNWVMLQCVLGLLPLLMFLTLLFLEVISGGRDREGNVVAVTGTTTTA